METLENKGLFRYLYEYVVSILSVSFVSFRERANSALAVAVRVAHKDLSEVVGVRLAAAMEKLGRLQRE